MILGFEILSKPLFSPKILRFKVSNPFMDTPCSLCSLGITKENISRKFSVFRIFHIFHIYLQATAHVRHLPLRLPPPTSIYRQIFISNLPPPTSTHRQIRRESSGGLRGWCDQIPPNIPITLQLFYHTVQPCDQFSKNYLFTRQKLIRTAKIFQ